MALSAREIDAHVGRRLRERRETLGISQGRLGRHLGLTFSQVQKYEKGANRIGAGRLYQIAAFLGVPVPFFFEGLSTNGDRAQPPKPVAEPAAEPAAPSQEVRTLIEAYGGITDESRRASVLALVRSLAEEQANASR